jgi:hypothetical protein
VIVKVLISQAEVNPEEIGDAGAVSLAGVANGLQNAIEVGGVIRRGAFVAERR